MGSLPRDDALADVVADLEVGGKQVLRLWVDVVWDGDLLLLLALHPSLP